MRRRMTAMFVATLVGTSLASGSALADSCYFARPLVREGKKLPVEPVCKAMAANLNKFCDQPPMVCGLKIHPDYRNLFSLPDWKPVPPDMSAIKAFIQAPWRRDDIREQAWNRMAPEITAALAENRVRFDSAEVDIYNLGEKEQTYRLDLGDCETKNPQVNHPPEQRTWGWPIQWYSLSIQYGPLVVAKLFDRMKPIGVQFLEGDLFAYRGRSFSYAIAGYMNPATGEADNTIAINRYERVRLKGLTTISLVMQNVCEIEYHPITGIAKSP